MDYSNKVNKLLKDLFFEDWMDESDWNEFLQELKRQSGISIESLCRDVSIGVSNGYSVDMQLQLVRQILEKIK